MAKYDLHLPKYIWTMMNELSNLLFFQSFEHLNTYMHFTLCVMEAWVS